METVENIVWVRTPAVTNATVPCPGQEDNKARNETYGDVMKITYLYQISFKHENCKGIHHWFDIEIVF